MAKLGLEGRTWRWSLSLRAWVILLSLPDIKMKEDVYKDKDTLTKIIFLFNKSDNQLIQISSNHKQLIGTCLKNWHMADIMISKASRCVRRPLTFPK